jgi:hypothetical protein
VNLGSVISVAAGRYFSIAVRGDRTMEAWGDNSSGQRTVPASLPPVLAADGGESHTLVLLADGTVRAWGANSFGQCSVPAGLSSVVSIAAGFRHSVARLSSGAIVAWGDPSYGATAVPQGLASTGAIDANSTGFSTAAIRCASPSPASLASPELVPFNFGNNPSWSASGISRCTTGAVLVVTARGTLGTSTRFLTLRAEGVVLATGVLGQGSGAGSCTLMASSASIPISPATFAQLTADGVLAISVEPSISATSAGCANATLTMRLDYLPDVQDCDNNGNADSCDLVAGAEDVNTNGRLDSCEFAYGDLNLDGHVDGADLGALLGIWGLMNPPYGDLDGNGAVNGGDLGLLLGNWGAMP